MQLAECPHVKINNIKMFSERERVCECRAAFVIDLEEGGYTVVARNLPGVVSEGDDMPSATENIKDAFREMVLSYLAANEEVPWVDGKVEVEGQIEVEKRLLVNL